MTDRMLTIPMPNTKQRMFLTAKCRYVAFGGARGGGKSWAVRVKSILLACRWPGITIMIMRRSYPELHANHIMPMSQMLAGRARYTDGKKMFRFPNGSTILFRYAAREGDLDNYQGTETDVLFLDEATQFSEIMFKKMLAFVRGANVFPKRVYLTCNPGGPGHGWVKRLFVDRDFKSDENPDDYIFIQSLVRDNTALMASNPEYLQQLESLPDKLKKAWLYGDWNVFEGQFFEDFVDDREHYQDRLWTHVIDPFEIPKEWPIYRSFDYGYAKPFSCAWWACDYDGRLYRVLELYGCTSEPNDGVKWVPEKIFSEIARVESEHRWLRGKHITGVADPSIWDASRGESIAETAERHRIYFTPGDNKRIPGWAQFHYRLAFDENGYPMVYIFNTCSAFIRTIPTLIYDDIRPEDLDTDGEDHVADESRYMFMSRPIKPVKKPEVKEIQDDPLDLLKSDQKYDRYRKY